MAITLLFDTDKGISVKRVRQIKVGSQLEGWKYPAEPDAGATRTEVDRARPGGSLVADVEGLTIAYVKSFRIVAGGIDQVTETDGIHVTTANLGSQFPNGVFIAQDGRDDKGQQNFKLVPWQLIVAADERR